MSYRIVVYGLHTIRQMLVEMERYGICILIFLILLLEQTRILGLMFLKEFAITENIHSQENGLEVPLLL